LGRVKEGKDGETIRKLIPVKLVGQWEKLSTFPKMNKANLNHLLIPNALEKTLRY
jgi:hypothetical protein